ncbi:MAG: hypothetical protein EBU59_11170, partial [Planctomycetia bacterium]|nr:hypothetical protein [Planctomycetia bacterium]
MEKLRLCRAGLSWVSITVKAKEHELTVTETGKAESSSGRIVGGVGAADDEEETQRKHGDSKHVKDSYSIVLLEHWSRQKYRRSPLRARSYQHAASTSSRAHKRRRTVAFVSCSPPRRALSKVRSFFLAVGICPELKADEKTGHSVEQIEATP